jgi:hypothetical protein
MLRVRGAGLRLCIRPIAFGNALGSAIAGNITTQTDAEKIANAPNQYDAETQRLQGYENAATASERANAAAGTDGYGGGTRYTPAYDQPYDIAPGRANGAGFSGGVVFPNTTQNNRSAIKLDYKDDVRQLLNDPEFADVGLPSNGAIFSGKPFIRNEDPNFDALVNQGKFAAGAEQNTGYNGYDEYGILTNPAAAPIGESIGNPAARAISGGVDGLHNFKFGALSTIDDEAAAAVRAGDNGALRSAALRHTFLDLGLPGTPQELALFLVGGEIAKPVLGGVAGGLGKILPDVFSEAINIEILPSKSNFKLPSYQTGAIDLSASADQKIFANQLPERLAEELATAKAAGVTPISPVSPAFDSVIEQGTVKYAVKPNGELVVLPKYAPNGEEISHAVLTGGKPVISAGEAEIAGNAGEGYFGLRINNESGHFLNGATAAQNATANAIARKAFIKFGINF